jgi:cysteine desulfurase/selenocysteine lyase
MTLSVSWRMSKLATIMNTGDGVPTPGVLPGGSGEEALASQIARLANEFFSGTTGAPFTGAPTPAAPPAVGPSALSVGSGGISPAFALPLVPGAIQKPPLPNAPPPKESDLRTMPALFSESLGGPSPVTLALTDTSSTPGELPYFLALAGPPALPSAPSAPGLPSPPAASPPTLPYAASPPSAPALPSAPNVAPSADPRSHAPASSAVDAGAPPTVVSGFDFYPELTPDVRSESRIFDPNAIKRDFPILEERVHGRPLVWLDNAATTQKPRAVIDRVSLYYERENSNVHRAAHALAARATDAYESARDKTRRFLNAGSVNEIVFTRGATEAINLVAKSWGARNVRAGDEIVITWLEHHANIVPWQQLCAEKGACLRVAPVDDRGQILLDEFDKLLGPRTRLVSMPQVSNALGTIVPIQEMVDMAHRRGALALVDGAQAVSHMPVDVQTIGCDFYVFSGHKIFAPMGIGVLYGKEDLLNTMPPWQGGGNMIADVTFEKTVYRTAPVRFEAGTGSIADAVGLGAALDYVTALGMPNIARYEHELLEYGTERLHTVPGLTIIGTAPEKAGVLSFILDGTRTEDVGAALDQEGIAVRSGHHCAQPILRRYGLEATVRASLAPYNTREDIDALVAALLRLQSGRPRRGL